jgi:hypothetical protein
MTIPKEIEGFNKNKKKIINFKGDHGHLDLKKYKEIQTNIEILAFYQN